MIMIGACLDRAQNKGALVVGALHIGAMVRLSLGPVHADMGNGVMRHFKHQPLS